jgi:hypothetical protein
MLGRVWSELEYRYLPCHQRRPHRTHVMCMLNLASSSVIHVMMVAVCQFIYE